MERFLKFFWGAVLAGVVAAFIAIEVIYAKILHEERERQLEEEDHDDCEDHECRYMDQND